MSAKVHLGLASLRFWQALLVGLMLLGNSGAWAQSASNAARINAGTVGVISGGADGTYIRIAADLANVLDGDELRVLPIIGRGSLQNLRDMMFLRGVDIGIVQMDAREQLKAENLQSDAVRQTALHHAPLQRGSPHPRRAATSPISVSSTGKKVNIDKAGSGTNLTARLIFEKLGVKPEMTTFDQGSSYASACARVRSRRRSMWPGGRFAPWRSSRPTGGFICCRSRSRERSPKPTSRRA